MTKERLIKKILASRATREGAGVKLQRVFGFNQVPMFDPFLLLDHFGSDNPKDYLAGFPWHPHRGIETITYMIKGKVEHKDSLGNSGVINSGDVQWMTAGSGIIHQEMPAETQGLMMGFQLWSNLPAKDKMMHPRYRDVLKNQIPKVAVTDKVTAKIICGKIGDVEGPVTDIVTDPEYFDVSISIEGTFTHKVKEDHTVFAYVYDGEAYFDSKQKDPITKGHVILYDIGSEVKIYTKDKSVKFLLISGKPLNEPVAWYGPIVMNTERELQLAFHEYRNNTFIKHK
ncbi:MAG: pirin family protein [Asgard group archaeon]|nr:pirin family protein [Asgard group archaeon]